VTTGTEDRRTRVWLESEGRRLLTEADIAVPPFVSSQSVAEVIDAGAAMQQPVALKLMSAKLIHKSDAGGVLLNLASQSDIARGCESLAELAARIGESNPTYLITPMIAAGVETIIGAKRDEQFGPIVLFGSGGVLVEAVEDVEILLAPCTKESARRAIASTVAGKLLSGHRGRKPLDTDGLVRLLVQVAKLISERADITEVDLNPVITNETGSHIADVRIITA
jgi:acetyltransferase